MDGKKDDAGAIVGFVDGDVTGCYFIDEGLSGISGMNLEGRAEAVKPDDMTTSDGSFPSRSLFWITVISIWRTEINSFRK